MLYVSKAGAVLVGILILPQFSKLLGVEQFGIVAVVFSLQALLLTLDLGMSTLLSRDIAAQTANDSSWTAWRTAERVVSAMYIVLTPLALLAAAAIPTTGLSLPEVLMAMLLFWILTIQNIGQTALLAKRHFVIAGSIQFIGVSGRGVATLVAMRLIGANLTVFLLTQLAFAAAQTVATRNRCAHHLRAAAPSAAPPAGLEQCLQMARRARPLMLFGLAGAAVMQLDKPIVSAFTSAGQVAPYYLATTLCLTPLALLAGPVAQFFQPRLVSAISLGHDPGTRRVLRLFTRSLVAVVVFPSALLWALRGPTVGTWLGSESLAVDVVAYTAILLPGVAMGALGFIPYGILVARQDYRFQAMASTAMTLVTLCAVVVCALLESIQGVCWVYAAYHAASTLVSWARCLWHSPQGVSRYAGIAAFEALCMAGAAGVLVAATIALGKHFL